MRTSPRKLRPLTEVYRADIRPCVDPDSTPDTEFRTAPVTDNNGVQAPQT